MSNIYYESDNLVITWDYWQYIGSCPKHWVPISDESWVIGQQTIRLIFTIFVNWKLRTHFQEYPLSYSNCILDLEEEIPTSSKTLTDYTWLNSTLDLLHNLWYWNDIKSHTISNWLA